MTINWVFLSLGKNSSFKLPFFMISISSVVVLKFQISLPYTVCSTHTLTKFNLIRLSSLLHLLVRRCNYGQKNYYLLDSSIQSPDSSHQILVTRFQHLLASLKVILLKHVRRVCMGPNFRSLSAQIKKAKKQQKKANFTIEHTSMNLDDCYKSHAANDVGPTLGSWF